MSDGMNAGRAAPDHQQRQLTLRYFASVREGLGLASEVLHTTAPTVAALRAQLQARGGAYAQLLADAQPVRVAVNQAMAQDHTPLPQGAEVAFFPPVTGG